MRRLKNAGRRPVLNALEARALLSGLGDVAVPGWTRTEVTWSAPLAGGKTLAAGWGDGYGNVGEFVTRLNADGSIDSTFGTNGFTTIPAEGDTDRYQPRIREAFVRAGDAILLQPVIGPLWQVTSAGQLDTTFGGGDGIGAVRTEQGGRMGGLNLWFGAFRENADGTLSAARVSQLDFSPADATDHKVDLVTISGDGQAITSAMLLPRMSYHYFAQEPQARPSGTPFSIVDADRAPDGSIYLSGRRNASPTIFKFTAGGLSDNSFGGTGIVSYSAQLGVLDHLDISAAGAVSVVIGSQTFSVLSWGGLRAAPATTLPGAIDFTIDLPDGRKLVAGDYQTATTTGEFIARLRADGSIDTSFGTNGITYAPAGYIRTSTSDGTTVYNLGVHSLFLRLSGAVLVLPEDGIPWQVTANGQIDTAFKGSVIQLENRQATGAAAGNSFHTWLSLIEEQADGTLVAVHVYETHIKTARSTGVSQSTYLDTIGADGGSSTQLPLPRLNYDVMSNPPYHQGYLFTSKDVDRAPDGSIYITGVRNNGYADLPTIFKFKADGTADTSWGGTGVVNLPTSFGTIDHLNVASNGWVTVFFNDGSTTLKSYALTRWGGLNGPMT
ncbi:MAG: hypothetical protein QM770_22015 [Tepidisphaeraceae bacterium]